MAEVGSTGVSHMCDNSTVSVKVSTHTSRNAEQISRWLKFNINCYRFSLVLMLTLHNNNNNPCI